MSEEIKPVVEETKKAPDMTKVREAKKRKQVERDTALSGLQSQISSMASMMKADLKPPKSDLKPPKPDVDTDDEPDEPMVVTRKKQKLDDSGPSMKSEICKTFIVASLGLLTWYVQSVAFKPKLPNMLERIAAPVVNSPPTPAPPPVSTARPSLDIMPLKKKIGGHGLLE